MRIGLIDVDSGNFSNLPLMKLSAYHKSIGDAVEFYEPLTGEYDRVYMSKVFDFTPDYQYPLYAKEIIKGGTGYDLKTKLPADVENVYPDYGLYNIKNTAYGFLTRGCPRNCDFCIVGSKEGCKSVKVSSLDKFWSGQREIKLLDPNLTACSDRKDLLHQLIDSNAWIDFTQGLDIRLVDGDFSDLLMRCKLKMIHFAWDKEADSDIVCRNLKEFKKQTNIDMRKARVYILVNFDTSFEFDLHRVYTLKELGYDPYIMIYNKDRSDKKYRRLQRWVNNKVIFRSGSAESFEDYMKTGGTA